MGRIKLNLILNIVQSSSVMWFVLPKLFIQHFKALAL